MSGEGRPKLSDVLYNDILAQIRGGDFRDQARLPSEIELSQRFSVSRPIVREALGRLRYEGIIRSRRGSGSYVNETAAPVSALAETDAPPPLQSIDDLKKFYDFRLAIEGEAAYLAALDAGEAQRAEIKAQLDALEMAVRTGQVGVQEDLAFHKAIATASSNRFFASSLLALRPHLNFLIDLARSFSMSRSEEHVRMVQKEHAAIYDAIDAKDGPAARERMRAHIQKARDHVFFGAARARDI